MKGATSAHPTSEFSQTRCAHGKQNRAICHGRKPLPPALMLVFHSSLNKFSLDPVARQRCRVFLCSREQISFPGLGRNAAAPRGPSIRTYLYGPAVCCKPDVSDGGIGLALLYPARE